MELINKLIPAASPAPIEVASKDAHSNVREVETVLAELSGEELTALKQRLNPLTALTQPVVEGEWNE
jgi:hypothetical protein